MRRIFKGLALSTLATFLAGCVALSTATKAPSDAILDRALVEAKTPCGRGARGIAIARIAGERFPDAAPTLMAKAETLAAAHIAGNDPLIQSLRLVMGAELASLYIPEGERARMGWSKLTPLGKLNAVVLAAARIGQNIAPIGVEAAIADSTCHVT